MPVTYTGSVPDPFREGREVIVSGELKQGTFVAERDSLVTKCPSKFTKRRAVQLTWPTSAPPASRSRLLTALYAVAASIYGARSGPARVGHVGPARDLLPRRRCA